MLDPKATASSINASIGNDATSPLQNQWNGINLDSTTPLSNLLGNNSVNVQNNQLLQQSHHLQQQLHQTHSNAGLFGSLSGVDSLSPGSTANVARQFAASAAAPAQSFYNFGSYQSHLSSPPPSAMSAVMQQHMSMQPGMSTPAVSMQTFMNSSNIGAKHNSIDAAAMMSSAVQMPTASYPGFYDMSAMSSYPYLMPTATAAQYGNQFYTG